MKSASFITPSGALPTAYQHIPIAPYTWEVGAVLERGKTSTERIKLTLPHPALILSMDATVDTLVYDPVVAATIDPKNFRVKLDLSELDNMTLRRETASSGGGLKGGTVTLSKLASSKRFFMLWLNTDKPDVGFMFTSKYAGGLPFDVQIDVTIYGIDQANVPSEWRPR